MRRLPVLPTVIVALAVAAMVALGIWQLQRLDWKEGLLAQYSANEHKPPIPFPARPDRSALFRRAYGRCAGPVDFHKEGAGRYGFRVVAHCRGTEDTPPMFVQLGITRDPEQKVGWPGGPVSGFISHAPDHRSVIGQIFDDTPKALMLVADTPPDGLAANPPADLSAVPNNHFAYAIQWFIFAALAVVIYALAIIRRNRSVLAGSGGDR
ncbi:SURF1 family protein [Stakelama saccharophila]|uniref:SURF1-like protein n=1 Tax=Stakelama saccharophila TaxID=3075605 RepID=A0ABZ0B7X2_9SPHN|nr:SURF1 family protein [Stakelama sp. W311]WNO53385.1 SURF1 family protein [Stakelama sp. W311]